MSPSSPQALYHAIPQAPLDANVFPSDIELDNDDAQTAESDLTVADPPLVLVDSRIRWIHFILGCTVLLPWNVVITATPFFLSRLAGSSLRPTFSSYLSMSFTASNFIFLAHATMVSRQSSPSRQTRSTILLLSLLTFFLTLSTFFTVTPGIFFVFVLLNGAAQAAAGAYLQTSLIAVASLFGPLAMQAMMSGQAAVAVAVSGVQVLSAAALVWGASSQAIAQYVSDGSAEERSALIFFSFSTIFLIIGALAHAWLLRIPAYKIITAPLEQQKTVRESDEQQGLMSLGRSGSLDEKGHIFRVAKANIIYEVAVAYIFMTTLAVFPPITISVQTTNPNTHPLLFSAVHFLVFNVGDFFGRYICAFRRLLIWSSKRLLLLSLARTLFVPLFLMCNIQRPSSTIHPSPIISSDFIFLSLLFFFGLTNGYLSSLCMMAAPSLEHNPQLKGRRENVDTAATVTSFCLVGGLVLGSIGSFAVRSAICSCNPFLE